MADQLLICREAIIPIRNLLYITKNGGYRAAVRMGAYIDWIQITEESYKEMMENVLNTTKHKNEIIELKKRIQLLEQHISLMPGGTEYLLAEQDFKQAGENQKI